MCICSAAVALKIRNAALMKLALALFSILSVQTIRAAPSSIAPGSVATSLATGAPTRWVTRILPNQYPQSIACTIQSTDLKTVTTRGITQDRLIDGSQDLNTKTFCNVIYRAPRILRSSCWFELFPKQWPGNPTWRPVIVTYHVQEVVYDMPKVGDVLSTSVHFQGAVTNNVSSESYC